MARVGTPTDRVTVAVLGTGRQGNAHLAALAHLRDSGLRVGDRTLQVEPAVFGRDSEKVKALAERYGGQRTSTRLEELIEAPEVTVVDNCLVNSFHFEPLMHAIRHGKHVMSEKPLTTDLAQGEKLLTAAKAAGVRHGIVQHMRFTPGPTTAHKLILEGQLGRIFSANVLFGYMVPQMVTNRPAWFYKQELAGGGIMDDMMTHFFDLLRYLVGPIDSVYAATSIAWKQRRDADGQSFPVSVDDVASVTMKFSDGAIGNCFNSWVRRKHEEIPQFQVDGEDASLLFTFTQLSMLTQANTPVIPFHAKLPQPEPEAGWQRVEVQPRDPFLAVIESFLTGVVTGEPIGPTWEDAITNLRLVTAAYRSASEGREISLSDVTA